MRFSLAFESSKRVQPVTARRQSAEDDEQDDRTCYSNDDAGEVDSGHVDPENLRGQPAADNCAEDPDDYVADKAVAPRSHEATGNKTNDQPQYKPSEYGHCSLLVSFSSFRGHSHSADSFMTSCPRSCSSMGVLRLSAE